MERVTTSQVEAAFHRLRRDLGKRHTEDYAWGDERRIGAWDLDSAPAYGGYVIEEQDNDGGGIRHPLGSSRRNAREFVDAVDMAERVLEVANVPERETDLVQRALDECPHVPHLHIREGYEAGDVRRYQNHSHKDADYGDPGAGVPHSHKGLAAAS